MTSNSNGSHYELDNQQCSSGHINMSSARCDITNELPKIPCTRKSSRKPTPNMKFTHDFEAESQKTNQKNQKSKALYDNTESSYTEQHSAAETNDNREIRIENLFDDLANVEGKQIYGFNTPKKRISMAKRALNTAKESFTTRTYSTFSLKTPKHVRLKTKADISNLKISSESDISANESDYDPDESSETGSSGDEFSDDNVCNNEKESNGYKKKSAPYLLTRKTPLKSLYDYIPHSDEYFKSYGIKNISSDHTLNRLNNPRLGHSQLFSLLASMKLSTEHERRLSVLQKECKKYFIKWMQLFNEGYNILLYGLGSKRKLLQVFYSEILKNQPAVVVNGFFPDLTIKDIVDGINHGILELNAISSNLHEIVDIVEIEFTKVPETHLFLIINNIDGPMFRNNKVQEILSRLVAVPNIHMIASMDHINSPLLWDHLKLRNYNFSWWDATTMMYYNDETSFENFMLIQNSEELALSSMKNVFQSLTTNARKIFMLITEQQLKNKDDSNNQGVPFRDLYWLSREAFLVSSDLALRAQLTEFLDHKLIKSKRTADGAEHLRIPIANKMLEQFAEQQKHPT